MALVRVIRYAMTVWATIKVCEVAAKVRTETIIAKKFYVEMWITFASGADVLGLARAGGARGGDGATGVNVDGMGEGGCCWTSGGPSC